jgi:hypothetical protein
MVGAYRSTSDQRYHDFEQQEDSVWASQELIANKMAVRAQGMIAAQIPCQKSSLYKSNCVPNTIGPDPFLLYHDIEDAPHRDAAT